jgi:hypothetical protein
VARFGTDVQRGRGIQQMIDAGVSVTKVAEILRTNVAVAASVCALAA